jgi:hypothetical protein
MRMHPSPLYDHGVYAGFVELLLEIPLGIDMPNLIHQ